MVLLGELFQRILLLPDCFQFVVVIEQCIGTCELAAVVVTITSNVLCLQFEVSTLPEVERIDCFLILKLGLHSSTDLIKDLLAELVEEDFAFVLGVRWVFDHIDVSNVSQLTLLLTCLFFIFVCTTVPQDTVVL